MRELLEMLARRPVFESKLDDAEDDEWFDDFEAAVAKEDKAKAAFAKEVKRAMKSRGAYQIDSQFRRANGVIIIHRSTRPGIAYQVSLVDDQGPSGHMDAKSLDSAIKYAWDDVSREEKRRFR